MKISRKNQIPVVRNAIAPGTTRIMEMFARAATILKSTPAENSASSLQSYPNLALWSHHILDTSGPPVKWLSVPWLAMPAVVVFGCSR